MFRKTAWLGPKVNTKFVSFTQCPAGNKLLKGLVSSFIVLYKPVFIFDHIWSCTVNFGPFLMFVVMYGLEFISRVFYGLIHYTGYQQSSILLCVLVWSCMIFNGFLMVLYVLKWSYRLLYDPVWSKMVSIYFVYMFVVMGARETIQKSIFK